MKQLYPYQEEGVQFMLERLQRGVPVYNADIMGLGKTAQAAVTVQRLGAKNALVVTTKAAIENTHREFRDWGVECPLGVVTYNAVTARPFEFDAAWDVVILDEAHYVKSRTSQRTFAALNLARSAKHAILLSGTPMPNHPGELWCPIRALWPGVPRKLGVSNYAEWLNKFCNWQMTLRGPKVYSTKPATAELVPLLKKLMIRRKVSEVSLPPLRVDVSLLPRNAKLRDAVVAAGLDPVLLEAQMHVEEHDENGSVSRLRRLLGTFKAPIVLDQIARELHDREYQKIVIMVQHHDTLDLVCSKLREFGVVGFDGSTSSKRRQNAIDTFTYSSPRVFAAQQTAAGEAINLQVSNEIVLLEPDWSPEKNAQVIKRVHRIGSVGESVRARIFAVAGSVDEAVMEVCARKTRMQLSVGL